MSTDSQILLRQSRVRNGIIPITIVNFDMVSQHVDLHDTFEVSFSVEQEPNVPDWCEPIDLDLPPHIQFKNQTIDIVGSFYIKTIQQRFAYDIRYRLQITYKSSNGAQIKTFESDWYIANIPLMFIDTPSATRFELNDRILYDIFKSGWVLSLDNNLVKIQTDNKLIIQVTGSNCSLYLDPIDRDVVLLSSPNHMPYMELLILSNNITVSGVYCALCDIFGPFWGLV
eukprot:69198_1